LIEYTGLISLSKTIFTTMQIVIVYLLYP